MVLIYDLPLFRNIMSLEASNWIVYIYIMHPFCSPYNSLVSLVLVIICRGIHSVLVKDSGIGSNMWKPDHGLEVSSGVYQVNVKPSTMHILEHCHFMGQKTPAHGGINTSMPGPVKLPRETGAFVSNSHEQSIVKMTSHVCLSGVKTDPTNSHSQEL